MSNNYSDKNTQCVHAGDLHDTQFKGAVSPLFMASSYAYRDVSVKRYPRYFNTPNQEALCNKIAALTHAESALIFGSGMAAISTTILSFLEKGDHIILQKDLYGGTYNFIVGTLEKMGVKYDFASGVKLNDFEHLLRDSTKAVYIESPSNPLMKIIDIEAIASFAKQNNLVSIIDNTFASPINQTPLTLGIDVEIHSATKYMGGHSDICAGVVATSQEFRDKIWKTGISLGGSLSDYTVWLLERSIKTMGLRVKAHNRNAKKIAKWLSKSNFVSKVYYPGLKSHPDYAIAKKQMKGYTGMLSFELDASLDLNTFLNNLNLIKPSLSLAGVESTILEPAKTSHALMPKQERQKQGITDNLVRLSVGIEAYQDIQNDLDQALQMAATHNA